MNKQTFDICQQITGLINCQEALIKYVMERNNDEDKELIYEVAYDYMDKEIMRNIKDLKHIERI
jgi:hypothetical protein